MGGFRRSGTESSRVSLRGKRRIVALASILAVVAGFGQLSRPISVRASVGDINTFAGTGVLGNSGDGGPATSATFRYPDGLAEDSAGNVYIADLANNRVRKVDPSGIITDFAGAGTAEAGYAGDGGAATAAELNFPDFLAIDASGNVYITDVNNNVIRKVNTAGIISTVAGTGAAGYAGDGGAATAAQLNGPQGIAALPGGGFLISDTGNNVIRKVDASGTITTIAGNGRAGYMGDGGSATSAELNSTLGVTVDPAGDVFVSDCGNNVVRKVDVGGTISTFAGDGTAGYLGDGGPAAAAQFNCPDGLAYSDGYLFVSDYYNNVVRQIDPSGIITTVVGNGSFGSAGDGGPATAANLSHPQQLVIDPAANLLIADNLEQRVREVSTIAPDLLNLSGAAPVTVGAGTSYSITWTVANPGKAGTATGVSLSDTLPAGLTATGASSTQGPCSVTGSTVTCSIGQLTASSTATVTVNVTAPSSSVAVTSKATVTANEVDPAPADNSASVTTYVDAADLSVTATASPDPIAVAGQVVTYTMSVQNAGPTVATRVQLINPLQSGVALESASATQGSCALSGQTVTCSLGTLGVGSSATVTLALVPSRNVAGITDTATVSGNQVDQNPANNTATIQTTVVLGVATQFTDPNNTPIIPGQEVPTTPGITGGADGNIWYERLFPNFGEYQNQIGRVSTKGVYQPAYTVDQGFIQDMIEGPDGNVWFSETGFSGDPGGASVGRITPQGKVTLFPMPCGQVNCSGQHLTVGPDGNIWFATATTVNGSVSPGIGRIDIKTGAMSFFPTAGTTVLDLTAGADGNIWYTVSANFIGRLTPSGVNTFVNVPGLLCGASSIVTGPDHLLWITDYCGPVVAMDATGGQPKVVSQLDTGATIGDIEAGPDAVYFSMFGSGPIVIGRATTAGLAFYSTGTAGFPQRLTMGPDGNIWFTDFDSNGNPGIGHVSPPPSGTTGAPVQGRLVPAAAHANKTKAPKLATGSNIRRQHKPPPIAGDLCADVINPAQGTVINGDVTVNDNGFGCILNQVTINGNLHVTAGAFADLSFSTVTGSVTVDNGGQVHIVGSHVTGSVTGTGSSFITMFNSKVDANLTSNPSQYGVAMICGSTISANLTDSGTTDTTFPSVIGDPTGPIPCARNVIGGNLTLSGNAERILVHGNVVGGSIIVTNNPSTAAFDIRNNNASSLSCSGNALTPTGGGNHGTKSGQCSKL